MMNIAYSVFPYRLDVKAKEPIELSLKIKNVDVDIKLVSIDIVLDKNLSLEKTGGKKAISFRIGDIKGNQSYFQKLDVYPFLGVKPGSYNILVRVNEHYNSYDQLKSKSEKIIPIKVI